MDDSITKTIAPNDWNALYNYQLKQAGYGTDAYQRPDQATWAQRASTLLGLSPDDATKLANAWYSYGGDRNPQTFASLANGLGLGQTPAAPPMPNAIPAGVGSFGAPAAGTPQGDAYLAAMRGYGTPTPGSGGSGSTLPAAPPPPPSPFNLAQAPAASAAVMDSTYRSIPAQLRPQVNYLTPQPYTSAAQAAPPSPPPYVPQYQNPYGNNSQGYDNMVNQAKQYQNTAAYRAFTGGSLPSSGAPGATPFNRAQAPAALQQSDTNLPGYRAANQQDYWTWQNHANDNLGQQYLGLVRSQNGVAAQNYNQDFQRGLPNAGGVGRVVRSHF